MTEYRQDPPFSLQVELGRPRKIMIDDRILQRFWLKVLVVGSEDCWIWLACKRAKGYGGFSVLGGPMLAHRFSWIIHHGPIPKGLCVLHACDNRLCVNPNPGHLFLGTELDNYNDMVQKGRRVIVRGPAHGNYNTSVTDEMITRIRSSTGDSHRLARALGISQRFLSAIRRGAART